MTDSGSLPTGLTPRLLARAQAAAYCGIKPESFDDWRRRGLIPGPIPGTRRWDMQALNRALDALSGIKASSADAPATAYDEWKRGRASQTLPRT